MALESTQTRNELFAAMEQMGIEGELRKQLRTHLCEQMRKRGLVGVAQSHERRLFDRVMASMVSEELRATDCGCANSLFLAESGFESKALGRSEIVEVMGLSGDRLDSALSVMANIVSKRYPFGGATLRTVSVQTNEEGGCAL
jgi:hypothetical protein